jgi:outer membrane protein
MFLNRRKNSKRVFHHQVLRIFIFLQFLNILQFQNHLVAQSRHEFNPDSADLDACIEYSLTHQILLQQFQLDEEISNREVGIALSDWLPQVDMNAGLQQYLKQPVSIFPDFTNPSGPKREITTGVRNTSSILFSINQVLFNNDVFLAGKTARNIRLHVTQLTREHKIELVVSISKAFYDILLSEAKVDFLKEDNARIIKSLKDAGNQYESGVSDKIDFKRAKIALNNSTAEIYGATEELKAKYSLLKELMGYPSGMSLKLAFDSLQLEQQALIDTTAGFDIKNRIEYNLLLSQLNLQKSSIDYYRLGFLPSLSAYANYNLIYQDDRFSNLYLREFPNSSIGLKLSFPIFEGTRRIQQLKRANLQYRKLALDTTILQNRITTEYTAALTSYKSNLRLLQCAKENSQLANEVYQTINLQYLQGIKPYIEVIISETDLRTSRINELNALYKLLSSKLDVENALGTITVN